MNQKVKELVAQAGTDTSGKWMSVDHTERLVELIVQDCIGVLEQRAENWRTDSAALEARRCITSIKEHFGIKQ